MYMSCCILSLRICHVEPAIQVTFAGQVQLSLICVKLRVAMFVLESLILRHMVCSRMRTFDTNKVTLSADAVASKLAVTYL